MDRGQQFPYEFTHRLRTGGAVINATHRPTKKTVGYLHMDEHGVVQGIGVDEDHQRKGVATGMWEYAKDLAAENIIAIPRHSYTQTEEGKSWAKAVGS